MLAMTVVAAIGIPVLIWGAVIMWHRAIYFPVAAITIAALLTISLMAIYLTPGPAQEPPPDYLPMGKP
jgi:uncharacterized membrane protein YGL010W